VIFADSSYWIAVYNRRDDRHEQAVALARAHAAGPFVLTNHVRGETWTYLVNRTSHASAVDFLEGLERSPRVRLEFVSPDVEDEALRWLRRHDELAYSFVDATSFAVMRAMRIRDALSFDRDFAAVGFRMLGVQP
jgi:predicted nucleic acid-binding protein